MSHAPLDIMMTATRGNAPSPVLSPPSRRQAGTSQSVREVSAQPGSPHGTLKWASAPDPDRSALSPVVSPPSRPQADAAHTGKADFAAQKLGISDLGQARGAGQEHTDVEEPHWETCLEQEDELSHQQIAWLEAESARPMAATKNEDLQAALGTLEVMATSTRCTEWKHLATELAQNVQEAIDEKARRLAKERRLKKKTTQKLRTAGTWVQYTGRHGTSPRAGSAGLPAGSVGQVIGPVDDYRVRANFWPHGSGRNILIGNLALAPTDEAAAAAKAKALYLMHEGEPEEQELARRISLAQESAVVAEVVTGADSTPPAALPAGWPPARAISTVRGGHARLQVEAALRSEAKTRAIDAVIAKRLALARGARENTLSPP